MMTPYNALTALRLVVSRSSRLNKHEVLVMVALIKHTDRAGQCWPSVGTIAAETKLSERSVQRALGTLASGGDRCGVTVERRDRGAGRTPMYVLRITTQAGDGGTGAPVTRTPGEVHRSHQGTTAGHPICSGSTKTDTAQPYEGGGPGSDDVEDVIRAFEASYRAARGTSPIISSAERSAATQLAATVPVDDAQAMIAAAFRDAWFVANRASLVGIVRDPNRYRGAPPRATSNGRQPPTAPRAWAECEEPSDDCG